MVNILPALQETHLDTGLMPGLGKSAGRGHYNFFFFENLMGRGAWWAIVHGVAKSWM